MILFFLLSFAEFNPNLVMENRKEQFLDAVHDLIWVATSDSFTISYFWKNELDKYRINVKKKNGAHYSLIYDSENLWKIYKRKKKLTSFYILYNLMAYDWLYNLPDDFSHKWWKGGLALLEWKKGDANVHLWVDKEGVIRKVKVDSRFWEVEIQYKEWMEIKGFPYYPKKWCVKSEAGVQEFEINRIYVNKGFCSPCTFNISNY